MRELTFDGFLRKYVSELSEGKTLNVRKLSAEAVAANPRLREPLLLYLICSGKTSLLSGSEAGRELEKMWSGLLGFDRNGTEEELEKEDGGVFGEDCRKVFRSFTVQKDRRFSDAGTKELIRKRLLKLKAEKKISNYRIYTDLKMNPGNINAWLKYGNAGKISLSGARRALEYVKNA